MAVVALVAGLSGCRHRPVAVAPAPAVRYVLEPAWQAGGVWYYPHESFALDTTGIASVIPAVHAALTTDNEPYDPRAMAAAMQAVQLPAIATVTDLENGRSVLLRVNDRGPASPTRLIAVTPGVAALLGFSGGLARVRVAFDQRLSTALSRQVQGAAGDIAVETAPRGSVQQAALAPLAGTAQEQARSVRGVEAVDQAGEAQAAVVPLHLAAAVTVGEADPGVLMIDAGSFTHERAARSRTAALADGGARLQRSRTGGQTSYAVRAGPYDDVAAADAALLRMISDGITDARIVVDPR